MIKEPEGYARLSPLVDYIDGQILAPIEKLSASISNPNTNEPLQQQRATDTVSLEQALATAERVHVEGHWRKLPASDRMQVLEAIADELEKRLDHIAVIEALTTGVLLRQAHAMNRLVPLAFRQAAREIQHGARHTVLSGNVRLKRVPWGPVALIIPWSAAASIAAHKVASALAAGCPVILKPSEWSPHTCGILGEVIHASALPPGTFQLVNGGAEVGAALVRDRRIRAVSFTGSRKNGQIVARHCAEALKPVQLELEGVNPFIVLEDADLDAAVEGIVMALTALNGQWCRGMGRLLIHAKHYHTLLARLIERLEKVRLGDSLAAESDLGPVIHHGHLNEINGVMEDLLGYGGVINQAGIPPQLPGYFMQPTLITNSPPEYTAREIFGPVSAVHWFRSDTEAITLANQPDSALIAYVYSGDEAHAHQLAEEIHAPSISINAVSLLGLHPQAPRSGWGLSGLGEAGVVESYRFFTGARAVGIASN